ncbi:MAG: hypothetical protein KBD64_07980 [Gammaproteobacteria bacterium]|nr:hypothetical protein [Gammaproteobacteria bacterium]
MITLGLSFKIDNMLFCSHISAVVARRSPATRLDWANIMKNLDIIGPDGVISKFKSGVIKSEDHFINSMLSEIGISGLVTNEEFIDAWNATLQLKSEDIDRLKYEISQIAADEFLGADTNPIHQKYIAKVFGADYIEATAEQPATLCGKILIRSYDRGVGISSAVLSTRDNLFEEKATERFREITATSAARSVTLTP